MMTRRAVLAMLAGSTRLGAAQVRVRAEYLGGTVDLMASGTNGLLRITDPDYLVFVGRKETMKVLFDRVNLLEYGQKVSRRYAMAILISPVLILSKKRRHFLTIGYTDDEERQQALVFEVHKEDIRMLLASLEARTGLRVEFQDEEARKAGKG